MKIIIPMAGIGKRLRPFTLTTPKPLIPIAGKPIVEWLVDRISKITEENITDIAFIIGNFPFDITEKLNEIGKKLNSKVHIFVQKEALGTAHAISYASSLLNGSVIIAFADTLFDTEKKFSSNSDVVIWTKKVENPQAYGVVLKDDNGFISKFVEKPKEFISNEAIIGIYYFKKGELLKDKINYILNNNIQENNEYQLTDALQMLLDDGLKFSSHQISEWLDCGNKELLLNTMKYVVNHFISLKLDTKNIKNSLVIQPVYIAENVKISNSIVGPNVSIEKDTIIENSIISNTIVNFNSKLVSANITDSLIGSEVQLNFKSLNLNIGDFNSIKI